jgi:hypothetical protein
MSTMQQTPYGPIAGLITPNRSNAQSEPARRLLELQEALRQHLLSSYTVRESRERLLDELDALSNEASQKGWDGYSAEPMGSESYIFAKAFIKALPTEAPVPELSADTDGEVALDWSFGPRRALTVSIGPTGRCTFAWVLGKRSNRGTDWIEDEIPASIASALRQLDPARMAKVAK